MDPDQQLSEQEALQVWNEEAAKLEAGDTPAVETQAAAAETPQDTDIPSAEEQPAETPAQDAQAQDPLADVRSKLAELDELKQSHAQLLHHVKTAEGRVAAMQRELQLARTAQQSVAPQNAPTQNQMAAAAKNPEKWEALKQDFPEWGQAMEEYVAAQLSTVRSTQPGVDPSQIDNLVQQRVAEVEQRAERRIAEAQINFVHKGWRNTVNTPEFAQWYAMQTPEVRALAASTNPDDAIDMLDKFEAARAKPASEIKQERGARLAAAATTRPGTTKPPKTLDDMSPEELWNYEAKRREKDREQRGF